MKKQIINPYIRFGRRAQGPYANRISGSSHGRAISRGQRACFYIVSAQIGDPEPDFVYVTFNKDFDETTCLAGGWAFYTDQRGATSGTARSAFASNIMQWQNDYGTENNSVLANESMNLDYTPGTCEAAEDTDDTCILEQYVNLTVANRVYQPYAASVGDVADDAVIVYFAPDVASIGDGWRVEVNAVNRTISNQSIMNGNLRLDLASPVSEVDVVTVSNSLGSTATRTRGIDGRGVLRLIDIPVNNLLGNFWAQEGGDVWLLEGGVDRWELE